MIYNVKDLSSDQRLAIESLLGRALPDDENLTIRPAHILKDAPTADERACLFDQYLGHLGVLAERVKDVPESEIHAAIDEAVKRVRHKAE